MNELYGTFLDACDGFRQIRRYMIEIEEDSKRIYGDLKETRPELAHLPLEDAEFSYGRAVPAGSPPRYRHLHQVPLAVVKRRNEEGGANFRLIANVCLVTLFHYWEERYRDLLARSLDAEKNEIQVPLFGDLRRYRQAIIHNQGVATSDVEACEILRWFKRGEPIVLNRAMFEEIVDGVFEVLSILEKDPQRYVSRA